MAKSRFQINPATVFLYVYVVISQVVNGLYQAAGTQPPPILALLVPIGFFWAVAGWLQHDADSRGLRWVLDLGLLLYVAGVILMPYYLIKTRGWRGVAVLLGFAGVYLGSTIVGIVVYVLFGRFPE